MSLNNYSLYQLQQIEGLSVRTCNICRRNGLTDLKSIIKHYRERKTFLNIESAGVRTDQELTLLCELYIENMTDHKEVEGGGGNENISYFPTLPSLSESQKQVLNSFTHRKFIALSRRGQNRLTSLFKTNFLTYENIYKRFIAGNVSIDIELFSTGITNKELTDFVRDLFSYHQYLVGLSVDSFRIESFKNWLHGYFNIDNIDFTSFEKPFIGRRFPFFKFINLLFKQEVIFSSRNRIIFEKRSGYFQDNKIETLDDIASELSLTRERVRQLFIVAMKEFNQAMEKFSYQKDLILSHTAYDWEYDQDILYTTNNYAKKINEIESVKFTSVFYTKAIGIIAKDYEHLFTEEKSIQQQGYLIKKELSDAFDFLDFLSDINRQVTTNIPQDYDLNFEGYLLSFLKGNPFVFFNRISKVCEIILSQNFSDKISFDFEGNIVFHRNTAMRITDYIVKILRDAKSPMKITEIYRQLKTLHPDYPGEIESLRGSINKEQEIFIYFGRKSTYGLREWEGKIEGIKGGTIGSIVEEYLRQFDTPKHISEIVNHLRKYRTNANEKGLVANLQPLQGSKLKNFGSNFWGLHNAPYEDEHIQFNSIPPSMNRKIFALVENKNGMDFNALIKFFSQSLQLKEVQVDYQLKKLVAEGRLSLSENGIVNLV